MKLTKYLQYAVFFIVSLSWQPSELNLTNFYTVGYDTHGVTRKVWDYSTKVRPENKVGVIIRGQPILASHPEIIGTYDTIVDNYINYNNITNDDVQISQDLRDFYSNYTQSHEMMVATVLAAKPDNMGAVAVGWNSIKMLGTFDIYHVNNRDIMSKLFPEHCIANYSVSCLSDVFVPLGYRLVVSSYVYSEMNHYRTVEDERNSDFIIVKAVDNWSGVKNYIYLDNNGITHNNPTDPSMYAPNVIYVTGNGVTGNHWYSSGYITPTAHIRQISAVAEITMASSTVDLDASPWVPGEIGGGVSVAVPMVASALALGISLCPEASNLQHIDWLFQGASENDLVGVPRLNVEGYINVVERECQLPQSFALPLVFGCSDNCADLPKN